jgi:O-antigen ligase
MGFCLFMTVVGVLVLRPTDIIPGLEDAPIYEVVVLACLLCSIPPVLWQLRVDAVACLPITGCVLGLLAAVALSHLSRLAFSDALAWGGTTLKVVVLYLLLVGNVTSLARVRALLAWLVGLLLLISLLSLLQYHGLVDLPALTAYEQKILDVETTELLAVLPRLCGPGIFHDPNDFCVILAIGMILSLYWLGDRKLGVARFAWLVPLTVFAYAATLTHSRGGFLALMVGLLTLLKGRLGVWRAVALGALVLPVLLVLFAGRSTNFKFGTKHDTSQSRMKLWSSGLMMLRGSPLFGIGQGMYVGEMGAVAHNSFVQAYTELGFFGGTLFVGAFGYAIWALGRRGGRGQPAPDRTAVYLVAVVATLVGGMFSLSRVFNPPTFIILGLVTAYLRVAAPLSPTPAPPVTARLAGWMVVLSAINLFSIHMIIKLFAVY